MSEICPYCGTRSPGEANCRECGGFLDDLSAMATQLAMGPWYFRIAGKPWGPGCNFDILKKMAISGKLKPESQVRGPATGQLWRRAENVEGLAHLTGQCPECFADVEPNGRSCFGCGTTFEDLPNNHNQLGLFEKDVADVVEQQRKIDPQTCPRCASHMDNAKCCDHCDAVFEPPAEATPMTLGPWSIRSKGTANFPGISYDRLLALIGVGTVTSQTILRGPTTEQFWQLAKNTEGIAHHVGFCHACESEVDGNATSCRACGTKFESPPNDGLLGLRFKTAEAIATAQKELDAKLKEIAATSPQSKNPSQNVAPAVQALTSQPADADYELFEEDDADAASHQTETYDDHHHQYGHQQDEYVDDAYDEHDYIDHDADYESDHNPAAELHEELTQAKNRRPRKSDHLAGHLEAVAGGMARDATVADHHGSHANQDDPLHAAVSGAAVVAPDVLADAAGATGAAGNTAADAKVRRQKSELQQNQTKLAAVVMVSVLMLVGVIALVMSGGGDASNNDGKDDDGSNKEAKDTGSRVFASQQLLDLRTKTEERWKIVNTVKASPAFSPLLTKARQTMIAAREYYGKQAYADSEKSFHDATKVMDQIDSLLQHQMEAHRTARRVIAAQNTAKEFNADSVASELWDEAGIMQKTADGALAKEEFAVAAQMYEESVKTYGKATQFVQHMREAADAGASIAAEIKQKYNAQHLKEHGGEPWQRITSLLQAGSDLAAKKLFGQAMESYGKIRPIFPQLDIAMRRGLGRRFYSYRAGRQAAQLVALKWKDAPIAGDQFAALKATFADLQLPGEFILAAPTSSDGSPNDFARSMIFTTKEQLEKQFSTEADKPIAISFNIGVNFTIAEQLLQTELGPLNLRTKNEIRITLKQLRQMLTDAKWNRQLVGMLDSYESILIEEKESSERTRSAWRDILNTLDVYKSGHPLTQSDS